MKLKILKNYDHRLSPAVTQAFKSGSDVDVPKRTAESLIERGAAEVVTPEDASTKGD